MKLIAALLLCTALSPNSWATDPSQQLPPGFSESNVPPRVILQSNPITTPPQTPVARAPTHDQVCIYEAGLLSKVATLRDQEIPERDTSAAIHEDLRREHSYTPEFRSSIDTRISWIYDHGEASVTSVRMGYLKNCDPKHFNWY